MPNLNREAIALLLDLEQLRPHLRLKNIRQVVAKAKRGKRLR
jgi:hypothetical protein